MLSLFSLVARTNTTLFFLLPSIELVDFLSSDIRAGVLRKGHASWHAMSCRVGDTSCKPQRPSPATGALKRPIGPHQCYQGPERGQRSQKGLKKTPAIHDELSVSQVAAQGLRADPGNTWRVPLLGQLPDRVAISLCLRPFLNEKNWNSSWPPKDFYRAP